MRKTVAAVSACLLWSCDAGQQPHASLDQMRLTPLSPYTYHFANELGNHRADYFLGKQTYEPTAEFRGKLAELIRAEHARIKSAPDYASTYVYRNTAVLNEHFAGDADALRGVHDDDLISYTRWHNGEIDLFYVIERGRVVFDMMTNEAVSPSWEFD